MNLFHHCQECAVDSQSHTSMEWLVFCNDKVGAFWMNWSCDWIISSRRQSQSTVTCIHGTWMHKTSLPVCLVLQIMTCKSSGHVFNTATVMQFNDIHKASEDRQRELWESFVMLCPCFVSSSDLLVQMSWAALLLNCSLFLWIRWEGESNWTWQQHLCRYLVSVSHVCAGMRMFKKICLCASE